MEDIGTDLVEMEVEGRDISLGGLIAIGLGLLAAGSMIGYKVGEKKTNERIDQKARVINNLKSAN